MVHFITNRVSNPLLGFVCEVDLNGRTVPSMRGRAASSYPCHALTSYMPEIAVITGARFLSSIKSSLSLTLPCALMREQLVVSRPEAPSVLATSWTRMERTRSGIKNATAADTGLKVERRSNHLQRTFGRVNTTASMHAPHTNRKQAHTNLAEHVALATYPILLSPPMPATDSRNPLKPSSGAS